MSWIRYDSAMTISNCVPEPNNKRDFAELFMMQYKMVKPLMIFWQCTVYITDHELSELKRHSGQSACRPRQRVAAVYGVTSGAVSWSDFLAIILSITFRESVEQD